MAETKANITITLTEKQAQALLKALGKNFASVADKAARLGTKLKAQLIPSMNGLAAAMKNVGRAGAVLRAGLQGIAVAGGAVVAGLTGAVALIVKIADAAAPVQRAHYIFENFAESVRATSQEFRELYPTTDAFVSKIKEVTGGLISTTDIATLSTKTFSHLGSEIGVRLPEMFKAAQIAATLQGKSVEQMMRALTMGAGRLYNAYFQQLGIIVDLKGAYARYAEETGKTTDSLSRQEKTTAALNEALRKLEDRAGALADAELLVEMRTAAARARLVDLKDHILNELGPAFGVLSGYVKDFIDDVAPRIEAFADSFLNVFYQMGDGMKAGMAEASFATVEGMQTMGTQAGQWAINALTWGANVGSEFAIGILEGFTTAITFVMNAISNILSMWLGPGSPPMVAPQIDQWGEAAMGEWFKGIENYTPDFRAILAKLKVTLGALPKQNLLKWGVDAIASWAKGLSIFDLSFLEKKIEMQLRKATDVRDQLRGQLKKERSELFKLQVLQKDPAAIRQKLGEVKATKRAVDAQEKEVEALEKRRDEIKEQLQLMRLIERVLSKMEGTEKKRALRGAKARKGAGAGAGAGLLEDVFGGFDFKGGAAGDLKRKMEGFANTLAQIFTEPLANLKTAWEENIGKIGAAWDNLSGLLQKAGILEYFKDPSWARAVGVFVGLAIAAGLLSLMIGAILSPVGIVLTLFAALVVIAGKFADNVAPNLAKKLSTTGKIMLLVATAAETVQLVIGLMGIAAVRTGGKIREAISTLVDFLAAAAEFSLLEVIWPGAAGAMEDFAARLRQSARQSEQDVGAWATGMDLDIRGMVADYDTALADMEKREWKAPSAPPWEQYAGQMAGVAEDVGTSGDLLTQALAQDWTQMSTDALGSTLDISTAFGNMDTELADRITPDMMSSIEDTMGTGLENIMDGTTDFSSGVEESFTDLNENLIGPKGIITKMLDDMYDLFEGRMAEDILGMVRLIAAEMYNAIWGVAEAVRILRDRLKSLYDYLKTHEFEVRMNVPPEIMPGSPPPFAVGLKEINKQLGQAKAILGGSGAMGGGAPAAGASSSTTVNFNEAVVGTLVVPSTRTGLQVSRQIARDIGDMVTTRRLPA